MTSGLKAHCSGSKSWTHFSQSGCTGTEEMLARKRGSSKGIRYSLLQYVLLPWSEQPDQPHVTLDGTAASKATISSTSLEGVQDGKLRGGFQDSFGRFNIELSFPITRYAATIFFFAARS